MRESDGLNQIANVIKGGFLRPRTATMMRGSHLEGRSLFRSKLLGTSKAA